MSTYYSDSRNCQAGQCRVPFCCDGRTECKNGCGKEVEFGDLCAGCEEERQDNEYYASEEWAERKKQLQAEGLLK